MDSRLNTSLSLSLPVSVPLHQTSAAVACFLNCLLVSCLCFILFSNSIFPQLQSTEDASEEVSEHLSIFISCHFSLSLALVNRRNALEKRKLPKGSRHSRKVCKHCVPATNALSLSLSLSLSSLSLSLSLSENVYQKLTQQRLWSDMKTDISLHYRYQLDRWAE